VTDIQIETQYSTGASRQTIEQGLVAAGKDLGHLRPEDLALLEDFHTMGRIATTQLADLVDITPDDEVLDGGSGIGGTARYIAERSRCHVVAVDLTEEYCQTARWLNQLAGLDDQISVRQADVTDLPFADATFTLMFSQHVQMNVANKALLYKEARRVLADGGRLAMWDIIAGGDRQPDFPVPWADRPEYSHLTTSDRFAHGHRNLGLRDRAVERPHRPSGRDNADAAHVASQPDRTACLRPRLRVESQEPHRRAGRRPAARRPWRRTSGLRRVAIRSGRRRTMTSKIVVGGPGALTAGGTTVIAQANFPDEPPPRARRNPVRQPVTATDDERPCSRCKGEP
jgi:sarcosine/dimethylglycine N-methyltransferase